MAKTERPQNAKKERRRRRRGKVFILPERCKGCGYCVEFCPTHVLALAESFNKKGYHPPEVVDADACTGCDLCGMYCPDFAIFGVKLKKKKTGNDKAEAA
jgi:2-oxoglutarate ferredoxin oxidoreductase subunit delta